MVPTSTGENTIEQITYHCPETNGGGEISVVLSCINGKCNNDPERYAHGYCAYFPYGYFSYEFQGKNITSENFNNTDHYGANYEFTLDVLTGKIKQNDIPKPRHSPECLPSFVIILTLIGSIFLIR